MNKLHFIEDFTKALADYHISEASKQILKETTLVLLTAPAAGGRNTIIRELLKTGDYHFIVSDTTRKPRVNDGKPERDGVEYWFRSEKEMLDDIHAGKFLEAEIIHGQQVSGISMRELQKARDEQKIAINEVDIGGAHAIKQAKPDTISVIVLPPTFEEWQRRFKARGAMAEDEHRRRLHTAVRIFEDALNHDYFNFIINDHVVNSSVAINELVRSGEANPEEQAKGRALAERLYAETKLYLGTSS